MLNSHREKQAVVPPGAPAMDPMMAGGGGGMPPMDPAMMAMMGGGGGMPPGMDPAAGGVGAAMGAPPPMMPAPPPSPGPGGMPPAAPTDQLTFVTEMLETCMKQMKACVDSLKGMAPGAPPAGAAPAPAPTPAAAPAGGGSKSASVRENINATKSLLANIRARNNKQPC